MAKDKAAVDPKRAEACRRAWETIRANRALKAAGQPVPNPASKSGGAPKVNLTARLLAWMDTSKPMPPKETAVEVPAVAPVEVPPVEAPVVTAPVVEVPPVVEAPAAEPEAPAKPKRKRATKAERNAIVAAPTPEAKPKRERKAKAKAPEAKPAPVLPPQVPGRALRPPLVDITAATESGASSAAA